ncbi:MAG: cobaltochelatase subunit CobN [Mesorhizobium amorphae]|nr:MAG: cobaltochelatase subunit CobN [Mesorhizobium amorphae]
MHILAASSATLDDTAEPVDLGQTAAEMAILSFSPSDLAGLGAAWRVRADRPSLRLASLADLRHPMSVDLWIDSVGAHAKVILVRLLGGYDWWRYGCDRLSALARRRGIKLALLPGECRDEDESLDRLSTLPQQELRTLLGYFREGGPDNMAALLDRLAGHAGRAMDAPEPAPLPRFGAYDPASGVVSLETFAPPLGASVVPILFYRSMLLAADAAPIRALSAALVARNLHPLPLFVPSLKDADACRFVEEACARFAPALLVTTTAFAGSGELLARIGAPVLQAVIATTRREAWAENDRGLKPADLAMHVVLPEVDGRVLGGAISFKTEAASDEALGFRTLVNQPEPALVEAFAERAAALIRLQRMATAERRVTIILPDYPRAGGRTGYAVGLDVFASALAILHDMKAVGYQVEEIPETSRDLLESLREAEGTQSGAYEARFAALPDETRFAVEDAWGKPRVDTFTFRSARFGNITIALAPDRGRSADRRADYHDPTLPPRHELLAFGFWLQEHNHALVHLGAHGTLEWLPGKTVALAPSCFASIVTGALPVIYPFIVSNPGEAAQAKRRIGAVTLGHLPPPLVDAGHDPARSALEQLVDEYAQADGLDRRRRDRLAALIVAKAAETGLGQEAGVDASDAPDEALRRIDAWLCDLKDMAIKDGLHVFGRAEPDEADAARRASAQAERAALLAALDGRFVSGGPSGAPARGRTDVLPTGRNLFASDHRHLPTPTAWELGKQAADEVLRRYLQDHGDWPRGVVIDLWGSASLRNGGEEIAQGLHLMGCRPRWDAATARVDGIDILPPAILGRPRVDVSFRISGLFRDIFPTQIALLDAAARAIAARDEADGDNPLAEAARAAGSTPPRIFGSAPGTYGAGVEDKLADGDWDAQSEIGQAYLDAASHSFGGPEGEATASPGAFASALAETDLLIHTGDDPGRDLLEGLADIAFIGGFASAVKALGRSADVIALDTTDPKRPRARSLGEAVARTVRARALSDRFVAGQMRHGPRGASEFAETVDRLVAFAETTDAVPGTLIGALHDRYLGDETVRAFLLDQNPEAAALIARRFLDARRRNLWHPLRNSTDADLEALLAEARGKPARVAAE